MANHCNPLPAQIIAVAATTPSCYATIDQGFPSGLATTFNPATDNITYIPKNNKASYVESYFLSIQRQLAKNTLLDIAYVGSHGVKLEGFLNANQKNPAAGFARPYASWPTDITEALNEFYSHFDSLQVKYEQRFVGGLTLLNSFSWERSLDNASASLEEQLALATGKWQQHQSRPCTIRITTCPWRTSPASFTSCPLAAAAAS